MSAEELLTTELPVEIEVRDLDKRELDIRIVPWDTIVDTRNGPEMFIRGAFADVDPKKVVLRMDHQNPPAGRGISLEERDDSAWMTFRVSKTQRGDEILTLASDGVATGASVGFVERAGGTEIEYRSGRRVRMHRKSDLREVSTTWQPVYERASVMAIRSTPEGAAPMPPESAPAEVATALEPLVESRSFEHALTTIDSGLDRLATSFVDRLEKLEERSRSVFVVPGEEPERPKTTRGQWMDIVLKSLSGERIPQLEMRAAEDVITSDNIGVVPPAYIQELIGVIDPSRPFMSSTRRLPTPASGMTLVVPVITQRPIVAEQTTEKSTLATQTTKIGTTSFDMVTKGGYGDISLQLLKRADRSFLDLYLELLAEAYAIEAEAEAVDALIHAIDEPVNPDPLNPNLLKLGAAYQTSFDAIRRPPDTIWLSTEAIVGFIDAKATTTNQPLYPGLTPAATAGGGISGTISGLRAVHVPALDVHGSYAVVGPSSGFAWAEDGTYTLQVDVPAKAGRDVALVGMLWFAPWYPAAFSLYNVAS